MSTKPTVLWWGRFDPEYSRNRILRQLLTELGWVIAEFHPYSSAMGDWEAKFRRVQRPDLVWVPCFRQRDLAAASRWALSVGVPVLFDPLISAYDKQVFERVKYASGSRHAQRLHTWEQGLFKCADAILADTQPHADYFAHEFGVYPQRLHVVYVGAEESLFCPAPMPDHADGSPVEALFYGSFIGLQGPQVIVEAARLCLGNGVRWTLLGSGPLLAECERLARGLHNLCFEEPVPYPHLPERIHRADILLGVFGTGAKAGRVIPNKVFQALACARPVVTQRAGAYPREFDAAHPGVSWVGAGDPDALAKAVAELANKPDQLVELGQNARAGYEVWFGRDRVREMLGRALQGLRLGTFMIRVPD